MRDVLPDVEDEWIAEFAKVVETGESIRFTRQIGMLNRWYDGVCQPIDADTFSVLFTEVTDRIMAVRRREALLRLGDELRDREDVEAMRDVVAQIVGETLDACRSSYGEMDHAREVVDLAAGWSVPGLPPIKGRHAFADYGNVREAFLLGTPIIIEDVETDPRTADDLAGWTALHTRAVAIMPVFERGRTVAMFVVHFDQPHHWTEDELAFIRNAADRLQIGVARLRAEAQQAILNGEIAHRLKNSLAMVQAIATQTLKGSIEPDKLRAFSQRLQTLGTAHDVLLGRDAQAADLADLIERVLNNAGVQGRYDRKGPPVRLGPRAALSSSLLGLLKKAG